MLAYCALCDLNFVQIYESTNCAFTPRYQPYYYTVHDLKRPPLFTALAKSATGADLKLRYKHSGDLARVQSFARIISTPALVLLQPGRRKMNAGCIPISGVSCCRDNKQYV